MLLLSAFALGGCMVPKSDLDDAQAQNQQLQTQNQQLQTQNQQLTAQVADDHTQICRLMGAIKYTVNSDLLFPSGSYQMSSQGQQIIGRLASQLAQFQQHHLVVDGYTDNQAIGAQLKRQGIDSTRPCPRSGPTPSWRIWSPRASARTWCRRRAMATPIRSPPTTPRRAAREPARRAPPRRYGAVPPPKSGVGLNRGGSARDELTRDPRSIRDARARDRLCGWSASRALPTVITGRSLIVVRFRSASLALSADHDGIESEA